MMTKQTFIISALVALFAAMPSLVLAQDACAISKWIQLPDETPAGIDIRCDRPPFMVRRTLADDFLCDQTGPITCVKFWGSWDKDDNTAGNIAKGQLKLIHLSIHSDVPAVIDPDTGAELEHSHPGDLLWQRDFSPAEFTETLHLDLCPDPTNPNACFAEGFWDPSDNDPFYTPNADKRIWLYAIEIPETEAFVQQGTTANPIVYWLDIYVVINDDDGVDRKFGWKTSIDHWNDNAVYDFNGVDWAELIYPPGHPYVDEEIDLAFEINTKQDTPPTEACCYVDDAGNLICGDMTVADCLALGGSPQGAGTDCTTTDCDPPIPTEACCLPDGSCIDIIPNGCLAIGGIPQGPGTDCATSDCSICEPDVVTCPSGDLSVGSSFLAGAIDDFAAPAEPATPDATLLNYITSCTAGYALQFDELPGIAGVPANSWFGHTFTGLPPGIVSATLEVRARATAPAAGGGLAWNDTIGFIDTITGCTRTDLWINRFSNLPEASGTWNAGQAATFCLDLDALPLSTGGTTSVISALASGQLAVWAQDDTGIDYIELKIMVCPCKYPVIITYPVETADNFAAPDSAPASPSAEITTYFSGLKGFDSFIPNRKFAHTFSSLPANIIGGTLEIGLRAHQGFSPNDTLSLEFLNPGFSWSRQISTLAPAGPWNPGVSKVVTLDLASLPPSGTVTSVIGDMTDGDLDVYIQDDTAVDYIILKVKVCCDNGIPGDNDHDGDVDLIDLSILAEHFLVGVGP